MPPAPNILVSPGLMPGFFLAVQVVNFEQPDATRWYKYRPMFGATYRRKAARCERMAKKSPCAKNRAEWLKLGKKWIRIAEQIESYSKKPRLDLLALKHDPRELRRVLLAEDRLVHRRPPV